MTNTHMNADVARAVRTELEAIGTKHSRLQRHQRHARMLAIGIGALIIAGLTTGAAIVVNSFPGSTTVTPVGEPHSASGTGTGMLELGPKPAGASRVILTVQCRNSVGSFSIQSVPQNKGEAGDFVTFYCKRGGRLDSHGKVDPWHMNDAAVPKPGSTSITITADRGTQWAATGQYATSSTKPWAKNAQGQSYGQCNVNGCPDLIGAQATNGKIGFVYIKQIGPGPDRYISVYESYGTTVIGRFSIGYPGK